MFDVSSKKIKEMLLRLKAADEAGEMDHDLAVEAGRLIVGLLSLRYSESQDEAQSPEEKLH